MKMFRKRYIPNEVVDISTDEVLYSSNDLIVTKWLPIKKRDDIGRGISYSFIKEGYKISKFMDEDGNFLYWYCDIIEYKKEEDKHFFIDLLVDIKIDKDGKYEVVDLDELVEAQKKGLIDIETMCLALSNLNKLLKIIDGGKFPPEICNKY